MSDKNHIEKFAAVLDRRAQDYAGALEHLSELDAANEDAVRDLREAVELSRVLRRLVQRVSLEEIHRAFGAPGDFGYETQLGAALSKLYRGEL